MSKIAHTKVKPTHFTGHEYSQVAPYFSTHTMTVYGSFTTGAVVFLSTSVLTL